MNPKTVFLYPCWSLSQGCRYTSIESLSLSLLKFYYSKHVFFCHLVHLHTSTLCRLPIPKIVQKNYKTWIFIISNIQCFLSYIASCELVLICPTVMGQSIRAFSNFHPLLWPRLLLGNWSMLCSQAYWVISIILMCLFQVIVALASQEKVPFLVLIKL